MADDSWYYAQNNQQLGPVTLDTLRTMVASGQVGAADLVWTQGMPNWAPAETVAELSGAATSAKLSTPGAANAPPRAPGTYPPIGYYGGPPVAADQSGRATTALCLGIASLPLCLCPLVGIGLGIGAIVVGNGVQEGPDKGRARAGVVCGIIGLVFGVLNSIAGVILQFGNIAGGVR